MLMLSRVGVGKNRNGGRDSYGERRGEGKGGGRGVQRVGGGFFLQECGSAELVWEDAASWSRVATRFVPTDRLSHDVLLTT